MNLLPTAEQQDLIEVAAAFLSNEIGDGAQFMGDDRSIDHESWSRCVDLGWLGLGAAEDVGGVGYGLAEESLLFRELGRALAPGPFVSSVVGLHVVLDAGATETAEALLSGEQRCGLMLANGTALDTHAGDLVVSIEGSTTVVSEIESVEPAACADQTSRLARVVAGADVATSSDPSHVLRFRVLLSASLLGIAEAARDQSVAYAIAREQFGKPIGTFQAVKHRCSDMALRCEVALSQLLFAALQAQDGRSDAATYVASSIALSERAARDNSAINIQNHGGIGFTKELGAHRLVARTFALSAAIGDRAALRRQLLSPARIEFS